MIKVMNAGIAVDSKSETVSIQKNTNGGNNVIGSSKLELANPNMQYKKLDIANLRQEQNNKLAEDQIIKTIEKANKRLVGANKEMRMSVHEETKKINIKIIDKETDEVIVEYPPEKLLDIFAKMVELSGLIVDERR